MPLLKPRLIRYPGGGWGVFIFHRGQWFAMAAAHTWRDAWAAYVKHMELSP